MKRITIAVSLIFVLAAAAIPAGAQSTRATPIMIPVPQNNSPFNAEPFNPDTQFIVSSVEGATIEVGESHHSCAQPAAGTGSKSIWFMTDLTGAGTLTLDTAGSSYTTGGGGSSNTVISLYKLDQYPFSDFDDLTPLACNENGTGAGIINAFNVTQPGRYYIQVSASPGITVTGPSNVTFTATIDYAQPFAFDEPQDARTIKFPGLASVVMVNFATRSLDEPVDPLLDDYISNTVWLKFTVTSQRIIALQNFYEGTDLWFSLFQQNGSNYVPAVTVSTQASSNTFNALVNPGTYYLRVGVIGEPTGANTAFITFLAIAYFAPHNYDFSVGTTEGSLGATPNLAGWTLKNGEAGPTGDGAFCDGAPGSYDCYFQLASSGAAENTSLKAKVGLNDVKVKKGDVATIQVFISDMVGTPNFVVTLTLTDASGQKQKYKLAVTEDGGGYAELIAPVQQSIKPVEFVVKIKNKDIVPGNRVEIDSVVTAVLRVGEGIVRSGTFELPLGGDIPAARSASSGPQGVLPVPAPPSQ